MYGDPRDYRMLHVPLGSDPGTPPEMAMTPTAAGPGGEGGAPGVDMALLTQLLGREIPGVDLSALTPGDIHLDVPALTGPGQVYMLGGLSGYSPTSVSRSMRLRPRACSGAM